MRKAHLSMLLVILGLISVLVLPLAASTPPASQSSDQEINSLRRQVAEQQGRIHQLQEQLQLKDMAIRQLQNQLRMLPGLKPPTNGPYLLPPAPAIPLPRTTPMPRMPMPGDVIPYQDHRMPKGAVPMPFDGSPYYLVPIQIGADAAAN